MLVCAQLQKDPRLTRSLTTHHSWRGCLALAHGTRTDRFTSKVTPAAALRGTRLQFDGKRSGGLPTVGIVLLLAVLEPGSTLPQLKTSGERL